MYTFAVKVKLLTKNFVVEAVSYSTSYSGYFFKYSPNKNKKKTKFNIEDHGKIKKSAEIFNTSLNEPWFPYIDLQTNKTCYLSYARMNRWTNLTSYLTITVKAERVLAYVNNRQLCSLSLVSKPYNNGNSVYWRNRNVSGSVNGKSVGSFNEEKNTIVHA